MEMKSLAEMTGGAIVMADSYQNAVFKKSFAKMFERDDNGQLKLGTAATITVLNSKTFKVSGIIGYCTSLKKKSSNVSDTVVGVGGTNMWSLGGIEKDSTYAFFFEITNTTGYSAPIPIYIQFLTRYLHSSGHFRLRVTTVKRAMTIGDDLRQVSASFDQEAAAAIVARHAVYRTMTGEESIDVLRSLDRMLIKLVARFGDYRHNDPSSLKLPMVERKIADMPPFLYVLAQCYAMTTLKCPILVL